MPGVDEESSVPKPPAKELLAQFVEIPNRYKDADKTDLNYTVVKGDQIWDIKLQP